MLARLIFAFAILMSTTAMAEDPLLAKARQGYNLAMTDSTLGQMGVTVGQNVVNGINQNLHSQGKALSDEKAKIIIDRFTVEFFTLMKNIEEDILQIYVNTLTERELDLMIEMYSDPEMAAMMTKMPELMNQMMPIIQQKVPPMVKSLMGDLENEGVLSNL